jgi:hypothetical protein
MQVEQSKASETLERSNAEPANDNEKSATLEAKEQSAEKEVYPKDFRQDEASKINETADSDVLNSDRIIMDTSSNSDLDPNIANMETTDMPTTSATASANEPNKSNGPRIVIHAGPPTVYKRNIAVKNTSAGLSSKQSNKAQKSTDNKTRKTRRRKSNNEVSISFIQTIASNK